jgi:hypothetical protein
VTSEAVSCAGKVYNDTVRAQESRYGSRHRRTALRMVTGVVAGVVRGYVCRSERTGCAQTLDMACGGVGERPT